MQVVLEDQSDPDRFSFTPDGSLVTEFVLMEQIYAEIQEDSSNDALWCHVDGEGSTTILSHLPHNPMFECLDIATPSTLGQMRTVDQYENYYNEDEFIAGGFLNNTEGGETILWGADVYCNSKVVGDGTINSLDLAVLMYAQFGAPPYYDAWIPKSSFGTADQEADGGPATTQGRENTAEQCGNPLLPNQCAAAASSQPRLDPL